MRRGASNRASPATDVPPSSRVRVRPAQPADADYVVCAFENCLGPYYGGDHTAHAKRLLTTHFSGGADPRGLLSVRQALYVLWDGQNRVGVLNLVFKRQGTCKISPLLVYPESLRSRGLGAALLEAAEHAAVSEGARQIYCTVAKGNAEALSFFLDHGYVFCGEAPGQYKGGETEALLRRPIANARDGEEDVISVTEVVGSDAWLQSRQLLTEILGSVADLADDVLLDRIQQMPQATSHLEPAERRRSWTYAALDRDQNCRGAAVAQSKKGGALKIMPIAASDEVAFRALVIDLPMLLADKGMKAYMHCSPSVSEVAMLQEAGWKFEAHLPEAYKARVLTQQWGYTLDPKARTKRLRIRFKYLQEIASGRKTLEIRVGYPHITRIRGGDRLVLLSARESVTCNVLDVRQYQSFADMLRAEPVELALPGMTDEEALAELKEFYPAEKERLGVYVIELAGCARS